MFLRSTFVAPCFVTVRYGGGEKVFDVPRGERYFEETVGGSIGPVHRGIRPILRRLGSTEGVVTAEQ